MTDLNTISFWKSRLKEEFEDPNSISKKLERENGSLLFSIHQAVERINENNELITKTRWHWWWQIKIAERIIKKFKINGYHIGRKQGELQLIPLNLYRPSAYKVNQEDNQIALKLDVINSKVDMMNKNIKVLINQINLFLQPYQSNQ
jgi:hypothetical protein